MLTIFEGEAFMKMIKKMTTVLLVVILCCGLISTAVFAANATQDGLEVVLTTDKSEYSDGEKISASLEITNHNSTEVTNVLIDTLVPTGYQLADDMENTKVLETLEAGQTVTVSIVLFDTEVVDETDGKENTASDKVADEVRTENIVSLQTGDSNDVLFPILLLVLSAAGILVIVIRKRKSAKGILSVILCITIIGGSTAVVPMDVSAAESITKTLTVTEPIKVDGEEAEVIVSLTYDWQDSVKEPESDNVTTGEESEQVVSDEMAALFGVDPNEEDTDQDGLSNYIEIYISETDPALADTDGDGIGDADEDLDEDGITNKEEIDFGTDLGNADSDHDGIDDYEELNGYNTNPCAYDTDGDTLCDGDEVLLGLDPLVQKTDGVTLDSERKFTQELSEERISEQLLAETNEAIPSLTLVASGNINKYVTMDKTASNAFGDSRAIVGEALDILGENISEGKLTFTLTNGDVTKMSVADSKATFDSHLICKYNADGTTDYLDTKYDAGSSVLSAEIDSAGTYFVMNVRNLIDELGVETLNENAKARTVSVQAEGKAMAQADIVFVIDSTGSMREEINHVKENVGYFIEALKQRGVSAGLALITYEDLDFDGLDSTRVHKNGASNWFYDMDAYKSVLTGLPLGRGGDLPECAVDALETARLLDMRASAGKEFILITDADYKVDNRYGIPSMEAEIELLKNAGASCSVISLSDDQDVYNALYNETNGIWADITGDFYDELMGLADKIGNDIVGDGYWIYLDGPVPVPVRLDAQPEKGSTVDTDRDGIIDIDELESTTPTGTVDLDALLTEVSHGAITGTDYGTVMMYKYRSNPVEKDTDFDGTLDKEDFAPNDNTGRGIMHYTMDDAAKTCNIEFKMDYRQLMDGDNTVYSKDLSMLSILYSSDVYADSYIEITQGPALGGSDDGVTFGTLLGLQDSRYISVSAEQYAEDKDDVTDFYVGHRNMVYNGEEHEVIVVSIRGTNGTNAEWSSNFDVGADTNGYYIATGFSHPHWLNKQNHKGFDVTANRVLEKLNVYIEQYVDADAQKSILLTGHSRGAAVANILGKHFEDDASYHSYTYTFATPNNTTMSNAGNYRTIFNVVNTDDIITFLPVEKWGFTKFGTTKSVCVEDYYENELGAEEEGSWEWFIGEDYNNDGGTQRTLNYVAEIVNTREEMYIYDSSDAGKVWEDDLGHITYEGAQEELASLTESLTNEKLLRFCDMYIVGSWIYHVEINYCPAYLMQTLANMVTGVGPLLGRDVAGKYADAKASFVASSGEVLVGGMVHPHMQATYYIIAYHNCESLY